MTALISLKKYFSGSDVTNISILSEDYSYQIWSSIMIISQESNVIRRMGFFAPGELFQSFCWPHFDEKNVAAKIWKMLWYLFSWNSSSLQIIQTFYLRNFVSQLFSLFSPEDLLSTFSKKQSKIIVLITESAVIKVTKLY